MTDPPLRPHGNTRTVKCSGVSAGLDREGA